MPKPTAHVALLRAVNLGPHNKVAMADLKEMAEGLGLEEPRTLLQSGNLVFRATGKTTGDLEHLLETETEKRLGLRTEFFVRTADEWRQVIEANPFPEAAAREPALLLVVCLKETVSPQAVSGLEAGITGRERVRARGREAYIVYPDGIGRSRLTTAVIEKKLGSRATGRNWNTVLKLGGLAV